MESAGIFVLFQILGEKLCLLSLKMMLTMVFFVLLSFVLDFFDGTVV
jgi:hypothetical protein